MFFSKTMCDKFLIVVKNVHAMMICYKFLNIVKNVLCLNSPRSQPACNTRSSEMQASDIIIVQISWTPSLHCNVYLRLPHFLGTDTFKTDIYKPLCCLKWPQHLPSRHYVVYSGHTLVPIIRHCLNWSKHLSPQYCVVSPQHMYKLHFLDGLIGFLCCFLFTRHSMRVLALLNKVSQANHWLLGILHRWR